MGGYKHFVYATADKYQFHDKKSRGLGNLVLQSISTDASQRQFWGV